VSTLRPLVPAALPIDTWQGQAYVGLVAFVVKDNRVTLLPPFPLFSRFYEINVRTYVRPVSGEAGVYFFSLDATNPVIAAAARALYGLPYHGAQGRGQTMRLTGERRRYSMSLRRLSAGDADDVGCEVSYAPTGAAAPAAPDTLASFLIERYLLYTAAGSNVKAVRVRHEPYPVQGARLFRLRESLTLAAGLPALGRPAATHYASGVDAEIFRKARAS
jgi:uncharacterized protein YqjF (DUF2071 family)